ncbi:hypothetical protein EV121DRAFT_165889, partial [Schizophyllum commune]
DMMLGAGMVIIQPETRKIVCVYERAKNYWFLPKGRKDVGQSLEETALREAYEEPHHTNTGMPDELNYESHLLTFDQARQV